MNGRILEIRALIADPPATSVNYAETLPASALEGSVYTSGDGVYQAYKHGAWKQVKVQIDDSEIESMDSGGSLYRSALCAINLLLLKINPLDYVTSGSAGAQSMSFSTIADVLAFFNAKKAALASLAAGAGDVQKIARHPVPVGGIIEEYC